MERGQRASGKFLQIVARALYSEHEAFPYRPKGNDLRIARALVKNGYFVTEPLQRWDAKKKQWVESKEVFFRPAPWLRKFSL